MKKVMFYAMLIASFSYTTQSCSDDDTSDDVSADATAAAQSATALSIDASDYDVASFTIARNDASLEESETVPDSDNDYVENTTFSQTVAITFDGTSASYTGSVENVSIDTSNGAHVVINASTDDNVVYEVYGTTANGSLKIYSEKKFQLRLCGVTITNPTGAAINIQSGKRVFVVLADGTTNTLTDGTSYTSTTSGEDMKACLFSEGQLCFSGSGRLNVYGNCKAGIRSDDYVVIRPGTNIYVKATAGNGIKGNDALNIYGGVVNVEVSAAGAKALSTDGHALISGGRTTAIVTGSATVEDGEVTGTAGLKADSTFTITGGEFYAYNTGKGGKGISTDQQAYFQGGTVGIITEGSTYTSGSDDSKAKGIKADGDIEISGGTVKVRATGGSGCEGIESKGTLTISGGTTQVYAYDDAINSASHLYIKGGLVYAHSTGNDGLDANGNLYVEGGATIAYGTKAPECGIDANEEGGYTVYLSGGSLFAIGGGNSTPSTSDSTQGYVQASGSVSKGSTAAISYDGTTLASFVLPAAYSNGSILVTAPGMVAGGTYTLAVDDSSISATASQYGSSAMGGGMPNGGMPGGGTSGRRM